MDANLLAVIAPWKRARSAATLSAGTSEPVFEPPMLERLDRACAGLPTHPRRSGGLGLYLVDLLTPAGLLDVIDAVARGDEWAVGVMLKPPRDPRLVANRLVPKAQRTPWGAAVYLDRHDPAAFPVHAALAPHVTLLRQRSPATWRAVDAKASHRTGIAAAQSLDCSPQAISRHLARSHRLATANTGSVVKALLDGRTAAETDIRRLRNEQSSESTGTSRESECEGAISQPHEVDARST